MFLLFRHIQSRCSFCRGKGGTLFSEASDIIYIVEFNEVLLKRILSEDAIECQADWLIFNPKPSETYYVIDRISWILQK